MTMRYATIILTAAFLSAYGSASVSRCHLVLTAGKVAGEWCVNGPRLKLWLYGY